MRPALRLCLWTLWCLLCFVLAVPWHLLLAQLERTVCASSPIFDAASFIDVSAFTDIGALSRHAQALTTALFVWAVLNHWRDGRSGFYACALLPVFLLQPILGVGDGACRSLEAPLPSDTTRLLYPVYQFDVGGLMFVLDVPTTVCIWACACAYRSEGQPLCRRVAMACAGAFVLLYAASVRRATTAQLVCSVLMALQCAREHAPPERPEPATDAPAQTMFTITSPSDDEEEEEEDRQEAGVASKVVAGDDEKVELSALSVFGAQHGADSAQPAAASDPDL
jgi:hypothetical protein